MGISDAIFYTDPSVVFTNDTLFLSYNCIISTVLNNMHSFQKYFKNPLNMQPVPNDETTLGICESHFTSL